MSSSRDTSVAVPPDLAAELASVADSENRQTADIVRDALEDYLEGYRWRRDADRAFARAKQLGLSGDGAGPTPEYLGAFRARIAEGLTSARAGNLVDGDEVFARLNSELDGLPGQGRS